MNSRTLIVITTVLMIAVCQAQAAPVNCPACSNGILEDVVSIEALYAPTVPLSEVYRERLIGDYVAAGVGLRFAASGDITISLPAGATIQNAFLYWSIMEDSETPSAALANVTLNGSAVVGTHIGTAGDPCWIPQYIHNYVADVTALAVDGINSVTLSDIAGILREGASLVVVFDDPAGSPTEVIIQHGAVTFAGGPAESATFSGFSALGSTAKTTFIIADGQDEAHGATCTIISDESGAIDTCALRGNDPGAGLYWDTDTYPVTDASDDSVTVDILSGSDCLTWVAQVLSVELRTIKVEKDLLAVADFGDGDYILEVGELWWFLLRITVTNTHGDTTITGIELKDRLGGDLELVEYDIWPNPEPDTYYTKGKTEKVFLGWDVGDLAPGDTATFEIVVGTDINTGTGNGKKAGHQEYTSAGEHELNSGANAKGMLGELEVSNTSDSIVVTVVEPN